MAGVWRLSADPGQNGGIWWGVSRFMANLHGQWVCGHYTASRCMHVGADWQMHGSLCNLLLIEGVALLLCDSSDVIV